MQSTEPFHYLDSEGKQAGPAAIDGLQALLQAGTITVQTLVWKSTMGEEWQAIENLPGLHAAVMGSAAVAGNVGEKQWMVMIGDKQQGPFALGDLADDWGESVTSSSYVWTEGMAEWMPIAALPELADALEAAAISVQPENVEDLYAVAAGVEKKDEEKKEGEGETPKDGDEEKKEGDEAKEESKKRKYAKKKELVKTQWFENADHTYMYVSGLPEDITDEEFTNFMKKAGMIKEDEQGNLKLKVYRDKNGQPKGDAKCCYLKDASVELALALLDGSDIRPGKSVKVEKAKFEQKGDEYVAWKPSKKKKKKTKNGAPSQKDDLGWNDFRTDAGGRVLVIKNVFDQKHAKTIEGFHDDLKVDMEAECTKKGGQVEKVTVFPEHPEGVIAVKFKMPESAEKMRLVMDGRWFSQRQLSAELYDGKTDYTLGVKRESIEDQQTRLDDFGDWLDGGEKKEGKGGEKKADDGAEKKEGDTGEKKEGDGAKKAD